MEKKIIKKIVIAIILIATIFIVLSLAKKYNNRFTETIQYNKKNYVLLKYNMDIFTYYHNNNKYYEEDIIHPVSHDKWDVVYLNGDLFILEKQVKNAIKYYSDDKNYNWYIVFDEEDNIVKKLISINKEELSYLYNIENEERNKTIIFDEIQQFADIQKISRDGLVQAIITLARVDGDWYYKTEIMTDDDKEYVIKLPNSLNNKINSLKKNL